MNAIEARAIEYASMKLLERATEPRCLAKFSNRVKIRTNIIDKAWDIIRLRRPRQAKWVEELIELPSAPGATVTFRRARPFKT